MRFSKFAGATGLEPAMLSHFEERSSPWLVIRVVAQESPEGNGLRLAVKLTNGWQNGFLRGSLKKGKSENSRVFIGDERPET